MRNLVEKVALFSSRLVSFWVRFAVLILFLFGMSSLPVYGQSQQTFTSPGSTSFTVPDGVTQITVQVWGAGGAGGAGNQQGQTRRSGGGGGGGAYQFQTYAVTPGQVINLTIGAGGATSAAAGGSSQISFGATTLIANGGAGGASATGGGQGDSGVGGAGGTGGTFNGGSGASGVAANGGGGGGSAGTDSNGNGGSGITGGTAVTGGGAGGNGTATDGGAGVAGSVPGGGAGGGRGNGGAGGVGGNGQVIFSWSPPNATNSSIAANPTSDVLADGSDSSTLTITVRDGNNAVMGADVDLFFEITSGTGTLSAGPWTTNASGEASATLTSTTANSVVVTGYLGTNNSGSSLGTASVGFAPVAPVAQAASSIGALSFTANWNASSSAGVTDYRLDVSTISDFSSFVSGYENVSVGAGTSTVVSGLTAETTYYYRVRAVGPGGTSINSNPINLTTASGVLPPDATNSTIAANPTTGVQANGVDSSTLTITLRDSENTVLGADEDVFFAITSGTGSLSAGPWLTNGSGQATATLTSNTVGTVTVTGYLGTNNTGTVLGTADVTFTPQIFTITGTITDGTNPLQNVSVAATGGHSQTVTTNASGDYTLTGVADGSQNITITPTLSEYTFSPGNRSVTGPVNANVTAQNFTGTLATYTLTIFFSGNGSAQVNSAAYSAPVTASSGTTLNLQAIPDTGWEFTSWTGDFSSTDATDSILMDSDKEITANFNPEPQPGVSLKLQYKNNQTNQNGDIRPHMILFNDGQETLNFTDITIRYWFVSDPPGLDVYNIDWAQVGTANVTGNFGSVGSERYLQVGFTAGAELPGWKGGTGPNNFPNGTDSGEIQNRINDDGFANYDQSLHYSWDPAFTAFADYQKITVYHKGNLVWGTPPTGGAEAENMIITEQPTTVTAGGTMSPAPTVKLEDALGNPVEGVEVTVTLNKNNFSGGSTSIVTSNASGLAVFDNLSINTADTGYQLTFNADAPLVINRSSNGFAVNAALAADMSITQQPSATVTAGSAISPAPAVTVVDAFGNPRSGVNVTVSLDKNSFASGTTTVATNASGVATFSNLIINTAATNYIITFNADAVGVDDLNSSVFNVNAAAPSNMTITTQPAESVAGGAIAGPPTVNLTDAYSNPVSGVNVAVSETGNSSTFNAGTLTKATNSAGVATFNDLQIDTPGTGYQLTFDADAVGVSNAISSLFNVVESGGSMSITQQPTQTVAGVVISPSPSITLVDGDDNPIEGVNVTVSLSENSFASGTLTVPTDGDGVAVFNNLVIQAAGSDYQITFNADENGVANVLSNPFNVLASAPASMNVTIQPNNTVAGNTVQGPPTVTIVDAFSNPIAGINITVSLNKNSFNSGTYTVVSNANGAAAFSDLVINTAATSYQIIFNADAVDVANINSNNFNVSAAVATSMSITTQPAISTAGIAVSPNPVVLVVDAFNNPKSGVDLTASLNKSSFAAGSTVIVTSNSSGEAVFNNLKISTIDTGYQITFSATSLTPVTTNPFEVIQPDPDFGTVRLEYRVIETETISNVIRFGFRIINESGVDLTLSDLETRYWFTSEPPGTDIYTAENAPIGTGNISGTPGVIESEEYMGVLISSNAVISLGQGGDGVTPNFFPAGANTGIIEGRINDSAWGNYDQSNDYSFDPTVTAYANFQNINVYYKGKLVWGTQPAAVEGGVELEFVQQPTSTVQDETITPAVTVRILDRNANLVDGDSSTEVTIAIQNDPSTNATLSGTKTVTAVNGIATFNNLSINNIGTSYTLVTTATGMDNNLSNSFNILSASTYSISGTILDDESNPISGVQVTASGGHTDNTITNASGEYSIIGIEWGTENVIITPVLTGYTFNPVDITILGPITDNIINQNFTGTAGTFSISGTITDGTNPIPDAEVVASGGHTQTVLTNASGVYTFADVSLGADVTITPTVGGFTYTPTSITVNNVNEDVTGQDFVGATTGSRTISGTILDAQSNGIAGVSVVATGDHSQTVTTNSSGFYQFSGLPTGNKTVTVTPTLNGYTFSPISIIVNNNFSGTPNVTGQDFAATVVAGTYYSRATGNWNVISNWSTVSHAGAAAGRAPRAEDEIIIGGGHTITLNLTTFTLTTPGTLTVVSTGVLAIPGTNHVAGTGTFLLESGGGLVVGSSAGITSSGTTGNIRTSTRTFQDNANFTYNGASSQVTGNGLPQVLNNLRINNANGVRSSISRRVNGTLYLDAGSLIMSDGISLIANTKEITSGELRYELQISGLAGYRMLSAPLNVSFENFLSEVITQGFDGASLTDTDPLQPNVLWYDETFEGTDNQRWRAPGNITEAVVPGRGYHVYMFGNVEGDSRYNASLPYTLLVNGQENEGTAGEVDLNVTYTELGDQGWNLVGNPFGASINWDDASWTKTAIEPSIYVWNPNTNQYATWNGSAGDITDGVIAPFQGFWVKAEGATADLVVNRDAKTLNAGAGFVGKAKVAKDEPSISIQAYFRDNLNSTVHLSFTEDGRLGLDRRDARRLLPPSDVTEYLEFYSRVDDKERLAVNNLPRRFGRAIEIPLELNGYSGGSAITGSIWLKIQNFSNIPEEWAIELVNELSGERFSITEGDSIRVSMAHMRGEKVERTNSSGKITTNGKDSHAKFTLFISPKGDNLGLEREFNFHQNYPNPFNPTTTLEFDLPIPGVVRLEVYDMIGRRVAVLVNDNLQAGNYKFIWDARGLSSGIYIARLVTADGMFTRKLTMIK